MKGIKKRIVFLYESGVFIWKYAKSWYLLTILNSILSSSAIYLIPSAIMQNVLNTLFENKADSNVILMLSLWLAFQILLYVFIAVIGHAKDYFAHVGNEHFKNIIFNKMMKIQGDYLENSTAFDMYRLVMNRGTGILTGPWVSIISFFSSVISLISIFTVSVAYDFIIPLLFVVIYIPVYILKKMIGQNAVKYDVIQEKMWNKICAFDSLFYNREALCEIKVFNSMDFLISERKKLVNKVHKLYINYAKENICINFLVTFIGKFLYFFAYLVYGFKVFSRLIKIGDFSLLTNNLILLQTTIDNIIQLFADLHINLEKFEDYKKFLSLPEQRNGRILLDGSFRSGYVLKNVNYSYNHKAVLKKICIGIDSFQKTCIVGPNGGGKTTLIKIICGLYENYGGEIFFNNVNLDDYSNEDIFNSISYACQNYVKYPFRVYDNIALGDTENFNNTKKYVNSIRISGADKIQNKLPAKEKTFLNKEYDESGVLLSEGEWQKLLIAKIIFRDKEILIFDEPTTALDPIAERDFIKILLSHYSNKTIILVSHRLSFAMQMDQIIVMKNGSIVEQGSPEQLINNKGIFYKYFTKQKNLYDIDLKS